MPSTAQIELAENSLQVALRLSEEARSLIDEGGVMPEEGERYVRLTHCDILLQCGKQDRAHKTLVDATQKLRAKAADMHDPIMEAAFMNIPTHRRLFELLTQLQRAQ